MDNLVLIGAAALLVFLNGFFVAAEFAIVKLRVTQADQLAKASFLGRPVKHIRGNLDAYLSACQLGITLASLGLGWIGEPAFVRLIEPVLGAVGVTDPEVVHGAAVVFAFTLISFLHVVVGEQAPKSVAIRHPVAVSLWTAAPLWVFHILMYPFIWVLNNCALLLLKWVGVELAQDGDDAHSADELKHVLLASHRHGELGAQETKLLTRALEIPDLTVGDLMRPWSEAVWLDPDAPFEETLERVVRYRYSRYPLCEGPSGQPIGLIHVKELYAAHYERKSPVPLRDIMRDLPVTHRDEPAMKMFRRFRRGYPHFAAVLDKQGVVIGFITLDHVLEALVGHIQDEFRRARDEWRALGDGGYEGTGGLPLFTLERIIGRELPETDVHSVGGLVMRALDRVPEPGDVVRTDGLEFRVLAMDGTRIERLRVYPLKAEEASEE